MLAPDVSLTYQSRLYTPMSTPANIEGLAQGIDQLQLAVGLLAKNQGAIIGKLGELGEDVSTLQTDLTNLRS